MLKAFLACLLVSVAVSPKMPLKIIRVGMTREQVEEILGEPKGLAGLILGPHSGSDDRFAGSHFEGVIVYFVGDRVDRVKYK